jgi:crotonobetainyl-CoA:carnitine CoA-transferase CaiB-like acyl-CoA transferase
MNYFLSGKIPQRMGNAHPNLVPYQVFRCRDGDIVIAVGNDTQFTAFCECLGRGQLAMDPRYSRSPARSRNRDSLIPLVAEALLARSVEEWLPALRAANVPCGPINDMQQVFADPQVRHRNMQLSLPHGAGVMVPSVASPIRLSGTPVCYGHSAPTLGEHSDEVLTQRLGLSAERIAELRARNIV